MQYGAYPVATCPSLTSWKTGMQTLKRSCMSGHLTTKRGTFHLSGRQREQDEERRHWGIRWCDCWDWFLRREKGRGTRFTWRGSSRIGYPVEHAFLKRTILLWHDRHDCHRFMFGMFGLARCRDHQTFTTTKTSRKFPTMPKIDGPFQPAVPGSLSAN